MTQPETSKLVTVPAEVLTDLMEPLKKVQEYLEQVYKLRSENEILQSELRSSKEIIEANKGTIKKLKEIVVDGNGEPSLKHKVAEIRREIGPSEPPIKERVSKSISDQSRDDVWKGRLWTFATSIILACLGAMAAVLGAAAKGYFS